MKSANVNDIKEALDFINEDVRRLAIAKEDFSLTWDTLLSEMTSLQLYKELEEFWDDMELEIEAKAPEIYERYLSQDNMHLSTVIELADLATNGDVSSDYEREESESIQKALASEKYDTDNYVKILFGCAMRIFLYRFSWESILEQVKESLEPESLEPESLEPSVDNKTATQYFACNCFIPFADSLINAIEEYRDGGDTNIVDAWAFWE